MSENTVEISKNEYKKILELAYKAAMLKQALLDGATLAIYGKGLYFGGGDYCHGICTFYTGFFCRE